MYNGKGNTQPKTTKAGIAKLLELFASTKCNTIRKNINSTKPKCKFISIKKESYGKILRSQLAKQNCTLADVYTQGCS